MLHIMIIQLQHGAWLPLIILTDVGEGSDLNPSNVGVLIQDMDVVVWRNPDD